jgi:hypothetical protein
MDNDPLLGGLPDWSRTIDPQYRIRYDGLAQRGADFLGLPPGDRRERVRSFSAEHCFPKFHLDRASGLYLFLRIVFDLPRACPRVKARVFGGWLHPSIGDGGAEFDLSWPVEEEGDRGAVKVARCLGYSGKGYDAIGEYDYFTNNFLFRPSDKVRSLKIQSS